MLLFPTVDTGKFSCCRSDGDLVDKLADVKPFSSWIEGCPHQRRATFPFLDKVEQLASLVQLNTLLLMLEDN